jgi:hypothetical protein
MFRGDLNELQQMALVSLMSAENEQENDRFFQDLRSRIITAGIQPHQIPEILEALDGKKTEDELGMPLFAEELSDEEMEDYVPLSVEEADEAILALRRFGILSVDG